MTAEGTIDVPCDMEHLARSPSRQPTFIFADDQAWSTARESVQRIRHILLGLIFRLRCYCTPSSEYENVDAPRQTPLHLHPPTRFLGFDRQVAFEAIFAFSLASFLQSSLGLCLNARVSAGCSCVLAFAASYRGKLRVRSANGDSSCVERRAAC
ncbi:hypothetical protein BU25DRAFT_410106 [Macroventuria anomochaeta]|uniref:Uncharacterized protein n=1 Tax=Macroventuria anomochaeta TaxID=301207 RepID=A0ACB6S3L1_9PLEO|nr:uncharacterized protein BU25DRAFT_410106 [Macroventuria anomochaeta]KAF2628543.1 hypothetical protein BU25DRAFT_410106 [Macroventuria anomochaeta]